MAGRVRITKKNFLKEYRTEIDNCIRSVCSNVGSLNDNDRWEWIINDEGLYNWAKSEGVNVDG